MARKVNYDKLYAKYNELYAAASGEIEGRRASPYELTRKLSRQEFETTYVAAKADEKEYIYSRWRAGELTREEADKRVAHMNVNRLLIQEHEVTELSARRARAVRKALTQYYRDNEEEAAPKWTAAQWRELRTGKIEIPDDLWDDIKDFRADLKRQGYSSKQIARQVAQRWFGSV